MKFPMVKFYVSYRNSVLNSVCYRFRHVLQSVLFVSLLLMVSSSMASQVVLDEIKIKKGEGTTIIDVLFGVPLKYQKHFPQKSGEIVQIQLDLDVDPDDEKARKETDLLQGGVRDCRHSQS